MKKAMKSEEPARREPDLRSLTLGRWIASREAFTLVAGRCAAADIEILRQISVDREIGYLQEFGTDFRMV